MSHKLIMRLRKNLDSKNIRNISNKQQNLSSSRMIMETVKEENPKQFMKDFMPLAQHLKGHYLMRKKKGKK